MPTKGPDAPPSTPARPPPRLHPQTGRARLDEAYPFDIENALFVGIAGKEPGTPLFLPRFSQAVRTTLRFQPGHVIDAERDAPHVARRPRTRQCHERPARRALVAGCPGWLVFRASSGTSRTITTTRRGLIIGSRNQARIGKGHKGPAHYARTGPCVAYARTAQHSA